MKIDKFPTFKDSSPSLSKDDLNVAIRICKIIEDRQLYYINKGEYNNGVPLSTQ